MVLLNDERDAGINSSKGINLTVEERTLLHLYEFHRFNDSFEVPEEVTQLGISRGINIHQKHVPRTIKKLVEKDQAIEKPSRITGLKQKRKAYFLTPVGMEEARKIKDYVSDNMITFKGEDEKVEEISLKDVPSRLDEPVQMVEVLSHLEPDGVFDVRLYRQRKIEMEKEKENLQLDTEKKFEIYRNALEEAWDDSVMTIDERAIVEGLRIKLGISEKEHRRIEDEVLQLIELPSTNREIYKVALMQAYADGHLSDDELQMLDKLRESMNISQVEHKQLEEDILSKMERKKNR